jgi:uncharacterized protein
MRNRRWRDAGDREFGADGPRMNEEREQNWQLGTATRLQNGEPFSRITVLHGGVVSGIRATPYTMEPDPSEFAGYVAEHRARLERERLALPALLEQARRAARDAAVRIAGRTHATRILLFGSLARGTFGPRSDIDLAVEGLVPGQLVEALAAAETGCPFPVDVLPLDAARPDVADTIRAEAEVLWPR